MFLRWLLAEQEWGVEPWSVGFSALKELEASDRRMWREFLLGFAPHLLAYITIYAFLWEEYILPYHLDLGEPNKFVRAMAVRERRRLGSAACGGVCDGPLFHLMHRRFSVGKGILSWRVQRGDLSMDPLPLGDSNSSVPASSAG